MPLTATHSDCTDMSCHVRPRAFMPDRFTLCDPQVSEHAGASLPCPSTALPTSTLASHRSQAWLHQHREEIHVHQTHP